MGQAILSIWFQEIPHCIDCNRTIGCRFACSACGNPDSDAGIHEDPLVFFSGEYGHEAFYCGSCGARYKYVGYNAEEDLFMFLR